MASKAPSPRPPPSREAERARGIQRTTLVAVATNASLAVGQIIIGLMANAFSLVADAAHTISDLFTDLLVLLAGKRGAEPADADHPYGHGRIETAASLLLGAALSAVGIGFLLASADRLQNMEQAPGLHVTALYMAIATLFAKEALFRFTIAAARRLKAPVLEANAWHARSDAASSLVVAVGIGGSLAGYAFLEPLAAAVVGFLILRIGVLLAWRAFRELIDTGLPADDVARIRATVRATPGVRGSHDMRTRRMADRVLCDTHILVDPRISVSEGHRISDRVHAAIRAAHPEVRDVLVHIDAEDDRILQNANAGELPAREDVAEAVAQLLETPDLHPQMYLHYLGGRVEVEVLLTQAEASNVDLRALKSSIEAWLEQHPEYRSLTFYVRSAP